MKNKGWNNLKILFYNKEKKKQTKKTKHLLHSTLM